MKGDRSYIKKHLSQNFGGIFFLSNNNNSENVHPEHHCGDSAEAQSKSKYNLHQSPTLPLFDMDCTSQDGLSYAPVTNTSNLWNLTLQTFISWPHRFLWGPEWLSRTVVCVLVPGSRLICSYGTSITTHTSTAVATGEKKAWEFLPWLLSASTLEVSHVPSNPTYLDKANYMALPYFQPMGKDRPPHVWK